MNSPLTSHSSPHYTHHPHHPSHSHTHSFSHEHFNTHKHTQTYSLSHTLILTLSHTLSHTHTHTHTNTLKHAQTHTHTHTHTHTLSHTRIPQCKSYADLIIPWNDKNPIAVTMFASFLTFRILHISVIHWSDCIGTTRTMVLCRPSLVLNRFASHVPMYSVDNACMPFDRVERLHPFSTRNTVVRL
jgi:hypothetical protein